MILEWQILDLKRSSRAHVVQFSSKSLEVVLGKSFGICLFSPPNEASTNQSRFCFLVTEP